MISGKKMKDRYSDLGVCFDNLGVWLAVDLVPSRGGGGLWGHICEDFQNIHLPILNRDAAI